MFKMLIVIPKATTKKKYKGEETRREPKWHITKSKLNRKEGSNGELKKVERCDINTGKSKSFPNSNYLKCKQIKLSN